MTGRLAAAALAVPLLAAAGLAGAARAAPSVQTAPAAVQAAPAPACEITAKVLDASRVAASPRPGTGGTPEHYRVRLKAISIAAIDGGGACDRAYLRKVSEQGPPILTMKEYARTPVRKGMRIRARIRFGGDEWFHGHFLSDVRLDAPGAAGRQAPSPDGGPKPRSYVACGCGCCGGAEPLRSCLYRAKGDDLDRIIAQDRSLSRSPRCAVAGCSRPIEYAYCD